MRLCMESKVQYPHQITTHLFSSHLQVRDANTKLLSVNFDPSLVRLLREVKYFKLAELQVPEAAASIYKKVHPKPEGEGKGMGEVGAKFHLK